MKKLLIITAASFALLVVVLVVEFLNEEERYYLSDWRPGVWIVGTVTNSIIVMPDVSEFHETEDYFTGYCDPRRGGSDDAETIEHDNAMYRGYFIVAKDASVCATALSLEDFESGIIELGIKRGREQDIVPNP